MDLLITVDVEGSDQHDIYSCVETLDELMNGYNDLFTLFVTPDIVKAKTNLVEKWLQAEHEIGLHLHPSRITEGSDRLTNYGTNEIEDLIIQGTEEFEDNLGYTPQIFRAGSWEFSENLLIALNNQGYERDASLRPSTYTEPFCQSGVKEIPITVYQNRLVSLALKPWNIESIPLHADQWLSYGIFIPGFYLITRRLMYSDKPYLMVSIHDYDLSSDIVENRIRDYFSYLTNRMSTTTLKQI